jgi:DNA-binding GntR family transcriptional regulator
MVRSVMLHPTLVDKLVDHVYQCIIRGKLAVGQRITEEQLAADFGVSRTPVREAVKRLVEMGVVVVYPRARLEVASAEPEDLRQISQFREDLECLALAYSLPRLTEDDIQRLVEIVERCEALAQRGSRVDTFRADSDFHLSLAGLSGNSYLLEAMRRLNVKVQLSRAALCLSKPKIRASVRFHQRILKAIRRRDIEEAQTLMRQHIRATLENNRGNS